MSETVDSRERARRDALIERAKAAGIELRRERGWLNRDRVTVDAAIMETILARIDIRALVELGALDLEVLADAANWTREEYMCEGDTITYLAHASKHGITMWCYIVDGQTEVAGPTALTREEAINSLAMYRGCGQ